MRCWAKIKSMSNMCKASAPSVVLWLHPPSLSVLKCSFKCISSLVNQARQGKRRQAPWKIFQGQAPCGQEREKASEISQRSGFIVWVLMSETLTPQLNFLKGLSKGLTGWLSVTPCFILKTFRGYQNVLSPSLHRALP